MTTENNIITPVAPKAKVFRFMFLALATLVLVCWFRFYYLPLKKQEVEAGKIAQAKATQQAAEYAAKHPPVTKEALILESECDTPCDAYIVGDFKIRTERHPLWIKFHGADWVFFPGETDRPGEGDFKPDSPVQEGKAFFKSPDGKIHVQVYKRINISQ